MPLSRRWPLSLALSTAVSLAGQAFAQAESAPPRPAVQECARAYESSQEHRSTGAISAARLEFERCRRDDCPEFIREDCSRWSKELEAEQPTVIFAAKRGSRVLTQVRVSVGDRVLVEQLSARAITLDPGEYDFRFETTEGGLAVLHALIQPGNKDRLVQVEFAPLTRSPATRSKSAAIASAGASAHSAARPEPAAAPTKTATAAPSRVLPWTLLAVGAASIGAGAALSFSGHSDELQLRETCSPHCTDAQVAPVHTKYLLSNISFGAGLVSLSAAAYFFLRHSDSEPAAAGTVPVTVVASPNSFQASYGARF